VCWCLRKNYVNLFHFGVSVARALLYPGLPNPLVKRCSPDPYMDSLGTLAHESYEGAIFLAHFMESSSALGYSSRDGARGLPWSFV
jgi:hypothetical protein